MQRRFDSVLFAEGLLIPSQTVVHFKFTLLSILEYMYSNGKYTIDQGSSNYFFRGPQRVLKIVRRAAPGVFWYSTSEEKDRTWYLDKKML